MLGLILRGYYAGHDVKTFHDVESGRDKITHYILISTESEFYKVSCDKDYSENLLFGDQIEVLVKPRVFNGSVYWSGKLIDS